ncbi:MAG TPA: hypothetical protein VK927_02310 [Adhaeribacter sp.]|nr:hypothetical protein [Adhaeribacter sp.]
MAPELRLLSFTSGWHSDSAIAARIENIHKLAEGFTTGLTGRSLETYQQLGNNLNSELNYLLRNWTVSGPAHHELLTFLIPIIKDVKILKSNDLKASIAAQLRLKKRLSVYQAYNN